MKKMISNKNSLRLAKQKTLLALKDCYLSIQHSLMIFLKEANPEEKGKIKQLIKETGESYLFAKEKWQEENNFIK